MSSKLPDPKTEIWFRPKWSREGRVGAWHLLAAGQSLPGGQAICGYTQFYKKTGFETTNRTDLIGEGDPQDQVCMRCGAIRFSWVRGVKG